MSSHTALTVPTRFVQADGIRFAYRRWGKPGGLPLVFLNYFSGNLDDWDPLVMDGFAIDHDVILFNNAGVASSGGETPETVSEMARDAMVFLDALGLKKVSLVGFSLGGMVAQQIALDDPDRVNKVILLGTGPRGGEGMTLRSPIWSRQMSTSKQEKYKALVLEAFNTLFNKRDYATAERFWSPHYIQHSAHIAPGREGLFELVKASPPTLKYESGLVMAEGDYVILHGRFSGLGLPVNWIVADIVRIENGILVEHWDVIQDEATQEQSKSGRPMFGDAFPVSS